jgi:hypothetical protein
MVDSLHKYGLKTTAAIDAGILAQPCEKKIWSGGRSIQIQSRLATECLLSE